MLTFITSSDDLSALSEAWQLSGFTRDNTDRGLLHARITLDAPDSVSVELFKDDDYASDSLVASGSGGLGAITLSAANGSGLSGSVVINQRAATTGKLSVFWACDSDLTNRESDISALLLHGALSSHNHFERFTTEAKRQLDHLLMTRLGDLRLGNDEGLLAIMNREDLSECAALLSLSLLFDYLAGSPELRTSERAKDYRRRFAIAYSTLTLNLRVSGDGTLCLPIGRIAAVRG